MHRRFDGAGGASKQCGRNRGVGNASRYPRIETNWLPGFQLRLIAIRSATDSRTEDALRVAHFGDFEVTANDCVFADDDGCVFVAAGEIDNVIPAARAIWNTERKQADKIRAGTTLRQQLKFAEYLEKRSANPAYTFREHLPEIGGAIEE
jgi:hypothetical protein